MLAILNYAVIPKCCVLRRLTKKVRDGLPVNRTSDLFSWGWAGIGQRSRYSELTILSAEASFVACHKPFLFDKMKECLNDIMSQKDVEENEGDDCSAFLDDDGFQPNRDHVYVGDPIINSNKNAPDTSQTYL